jgi:hypothetical protein
MHETSKRIAAVGLRVSPLRAFAWNPDAVLDASNSRVLYALVAWGVSNDIPGLVIILKVLDERAKELETLF